MDQTTLCECDAMYANAFYFKVNVEIAHFLTFRSWFCSRIFQSKRFYNVFSPVLISTELSKVVYVGCLHYTQLVIFEENYRYSFKSVSFRSNHRQRRTIRRVNYDQRYYLLQNNRSYLFECICVSSTLSQMETRIHDNFKMKFALQRIIYE